MTEIEQKQAQINEMVEAELVKVDEATKLTEEWMEYEREMRGTALDELIVMNYKPLPYTEWLEAKKQA